LSRDLPLDILSMILTAEQLRRNVGLGNCYIICGDDVAQSNIGRSSDFTESNIDEVAQIRVKSLRYVIEKLGFDDHMTVLLGSKIDSVIPSDVFADYQHMCDELLARGAQPYFALETAQIWALAGQSKGGVKVSWFSRNNSSYEKGTILDEKPFDDFYRNSMRDLFVENTVSTVYTRAGVRTAPAHNGHVKKESPYVCYDPAERLVINNMDEVEHMLENVLHGEELPYRNSVYRYYLHLARLYEAVMHGSVQYDGYVQIPKRIKTIVAEIS
ncbi:MAG: hypothetical protein WBO77_05465, partial [Microgenomates group bacterium]